MAFRKNTTLKRLVRTTHKQRQKERFGFDEEISPHDARFRISNLIVMHNDQGGETFPSRKRKHEERNTRINDLHRMSAIQPSIIVVVWIGCDRRRFRHSFQSKRAYNSNIYLPSIKPISPLKKNHTMTRRSARDNQNQIRTPLNRQIPCYRMR